MLGCCRCLGPDASPLETDSQVTVTAGMGGAVDESLELPQCELPAQQNLQKSISRIGAWS